jgi:hypothetical protein
MVDRAEQCDSPKSRIGRFLMVRSDEFLKKLKQFPSAPTALTVLLSKINPSGHVFLLSQDILILIALVIALRLLIPDMR